MSPTGLDQSWSYANPAAAAKAGVQVVSMYLSGDPSKNATATKIKAYHQHGIGVLLNWEAFAGAPLNGAGQGRADALEAVRQVRTLIAQVGYAPANRLAVPFSCDRDVTPAQWPMIDAYYRATAAVVRPAGFLNGVYGEASLVTHLHTAGLTDMEWQTLAWSGGVVSTDADFYQSSINQTLGGASVDFDQVIHADSLGAWWPPTHRFNVSPIPPNLMEQIMALDPNSAEYKRLVSDVATAVWSRQLSTGSGAAQRVYSAASWLIGANLNSNRALGQITGLAAKIGDLNPAQFAADVRTAFTKLINGG